MLNRLMFCYFIQKKGFLDLDDEAMAALAALYGEGRIGVRDRVAAYGWLKRAILAGAGHYQADLDALAKKMKKADVEKGEALAVQ